MSKHNTPRRGGRARRNHPRTHHELDPRRAAYDTLRRLLTKPGDRIEPAVTDTLRHLGADPGAAHRVAPMVEDAVRFAILFDHLISHVSARPVRELDTDVRAALYLFLAWFAHDPRAVYAHGNAAVAMLTASHAARGFVNAVVRKLGEFVTIEEIDTPVAPDNLPRDRCRLGAGRTLLAKRPILPDPKTDLAGYLSVIGSVPRLLTERCIEQHGPETATRIALACIDRPAIWIRPNPISPDADRLEDWWQKQEIPFERVARPDGGITYALPPQVRAVTDHPAFALGAFYVQDYAAQLVAPALRPRPGETLLDLCAAPGGKAGHLAELTGDNARVLACDLTEAKQQRITENLARMGYRSVATVVADAAEVRFPEPFDGILIDAPCGNSGVLGRRVEARHRITADALTELTALQGRILDNAAANLKPGGRIVYSVCSILMEEGVDVVHDFLSRRGEGWEIKEESFIPPVPGRHDGGYYCRIAAP